MPNWHQNLLCTLLYACPGLTCNDALSLWIKGRSCPTQGLQCVWCLFGKLLVHSHQSCEADACWYAAVQSFIDARPEQIQEVVQTNLLGCMLCTRAAMRVMAAQPRGGHIFNMDGAGADGLPTPQYAAYGATKAGALQPPFCLLLKSLRVPECISCEGT